MMTLRRLAQASICLAYGFMGALYASLNRVSTAGLTNAN